MHLYYLGGIDMLYRIGTEKEITDAVIQKLPYEVVRELLRSTIILDYAYGPERDYLLSGGYSLIAESAEDVEEIRKIVNFHIHPCEWVELVCGYICALYLLNDDYGIVVYIPKTAAPDVLKHEIRDE